MACHGHQNCHQWLFLEAWMSVKDANTGNDHIVIPELYVVVQICPWFNVF